MNRILYFLSGALLFGSCSLSETTDMSINARPRLVVNYEYVDDLGKITTAQEMAWTDLFVFDPEDRFLLQRHFALADIKAEKGITLLEGVPEGRYRVVCFANVDKNEFSPLIPGLSTPDNLRLGFSSGETTVSSDPLLYHSDHYMVHRGDPIIRSARLDKLFYRLDIQVAGATKIRDFSVQFSGAPSGFDGMGNPLSDPVSFIPKLHSNMNGMLVGSLDIPKFENGSHVMMTLSSEGRVLSKMSFSDYLDENGERIDLSVRDVVIPVSISVESSQVTVVVDDWEEGAVQLPILGV